MPGLKSYHKPLKYVHDDEVNQVVNDSNARDNIINSQVRIIDLSDTKKLVIVRKFNDVGTHIDARFWVKFSGIERKFWPTKRGLFMLESDFVERVLPILNDFCAPQNRTTA